MEIQIAWHESHEKGYGQAWRRSLATALDIDHARDARESWPVRQAVEKEYA